MMQVKRVRIALVVGTGALLILAGCSNQPASTATPDNSAPGAIPSDADPELVQIYQNIVEKEMPGVSFDLLQKAKDEGTINLYHIRLPDANAGLMGEFQKEFPFIQFTEVEDSGPPLMQRFLTEERAGQYNADIIQGTDTTAMDSAIDEGFIAQYQVTSESYFPEASYRSGYYYPLGQATRATILYNTNLISDAQAAKLKDFKGLWDPALAGKKIVLTDPSSASAAMLFWYYLDQTYGQESWQKLAALNPLIQSGTPAAQSIASGDAAYGVVSENVALAAYNSGAPVQWTIPSPKLVEYIPEAIAANAPHPNAARLFQEFVMSQTGQSILGKLSDPSARTDVPELRDVAKQPWYSSPSEVYAADKSQIAAKSDELVNEWKTLFQG